VLQGGLVETDSEHFREAAARGQEHGGAADKQKAADFGGDRAGTDKEPREPVFVQAGGPARGGIVDVFAVLRHDSKLGGEEADRRGEGE
jgi:hypothetical protein